MNLQPLGDRLIVEVLDEEETTVSEEGDEIIFSKYGGTEIKLGTDEVLILRESDVLAKVVGDRELAGAKS